MKHLLHFPATILLFLLATAGPCGAMISVGPLSPEKAREMGITMKWRKNGDAGIKVWLEFQKKGFHNDFTYVELRMEDAKGKHLVSAMLKPNPVTHGQSKDLVTVSFSADPSQLKNCSFWVVSYGSKFGDVGWILKVTESIEVDEEKG